MLTTPVTSAFRSLKRLQLRVPVCQEKSVAPSPRNAAPAGHRGIRVTPDTMAGAASIEGVPREDRERWNARYRDGFVPSFEPHPLAVRAVELGLGDGPAADLACGPSGSALYIAASGHRVIAVDVSEVALGMLSTEAHRRGLATLITAVQGDLSAWRHAPGTGLVLVLCTGFWDASVFGAAVTAVAAGGLIAWEAFTEQARRTRPEHPLEWCLRDGEPASLLPASFTVIEQSDVAGFRRRLLARRAS